MFHVHLILVVQREEKGWQKLRLSVWIHRLYNLVFVASLPTGIFCVHILDPSLLAWGNTAVEQELWLYCTSEQGRGNWVALDVNVFVLFLPVKNKCFIISVTICFPINQAFLPWKWPKPKVSATGTWRLIAGVKSSRSEDMSGCFYSLKYDDLFTWCSSLKISLTMLDDALYEEHKKIFKTP